MVLFIIPKGNKHLVQDDKGRVIYTIKKKGFGYKFIIYDNSDYALYTMTGDFSERHPVYNISLNDKLYLWVKCKSRFLEPSMIIKGDTGEYLLKTTDKLNFDFFKGSDRIGSIAVQQLPTGDTQFAMSVNDKEYDDALPLLALCVESSFVNFKK